MRQFIHGSDRGNAILLSLILILSISLIFLSVIPRITSVYEYAVKYKEKVFLEIQSENREIITKYDLY